MRVLVACESSGAVRDAFIRKGHDAMSCDLLPADKGTDGTHHHQGDVFKLLAQDTGFDLMVAHPPCTYLASSSMHWTTRGLRPKVWTTRALAFFKALLDMPIPMICIENPVGVPATRIRPPDQYIQPYQFGHLESKKTGLWLKNLPLLLPTRVMQPPSWGCCHDGEKWDYRLGAKGCPVCRGRHKALPRWNNQDACGQNNVSGADRWKKRSKTYLGIANAMASQWGIILP